MTIQKLISLLIIFLSCLFLISCDIVFYNPFIASTYNEKPSLPTSSPTLLFRSVGKTQSNLNTGNETVQITGNNAFFSAALPDNIGVGDVLQYQITGTYYLAFITARTNSTAYTVHSNDGNTPQSCPAGTNVQIFRAHDSLFKWESQSVSNVNSNIDDSVDDDVLLPSIDLVSNNTIALITCYGDAADTTAVIIEGWTTGPDNYIKIYTPTSLSEVGQSQRHDGKWNNSAYYMERNGDCIKISEANVWVEGLQIDIIPPTTGLFPDGIIINSDVQNIKISHNIIKDSFQDETSTGIYYMTDDSDINVYIWNNLIYNFSGISSIGIYIQAAANGINIYNNTVYNCTIGIRNRDEKGISHPLLKNNLVHSCSYRDYYEDSFDFNDNSANNLGEEADFGNGTGYIQTTQIADDIFVDWANEDFNILLSSDAYDNGIDLSADTSFPFSDDIKGVTRTGTWDIGAAEYN